DGSNWSVLPNWEASQGIVNDILSISHIPSPKQPLEIQFEDDIFFKPIVLHLLGFMAGDTPADRRKAAHRSSGFMIADGKLWKVSSKANDRVARTECIPSSQGFAQALKTHTTNGCFGPDLTQLHLRDKYFWP
ncbi:hypothetical protein BDZ94DRAFT_1118921, partial [Collybia nuda]